MLDIKELMKLSVEEREVALFKELHTIAVNEHIEKRKSNNGGPELSYLSWAWAFDTIQQLVPISYEIKQFPNENGVLVPYQYDKSTGYMVFTEMTILGITKTMWLPVMDGANKAMKAEPYTYTTKNGSKNVASADMFDVNKTLMRCLVKNLAMFGLGLYIYSGDDLPEKQQETDQNNNVGQQEVKPLAANPQPVVDLLAPIKNAINAIGDINSLMSLYLDHQNEVEGNPEIKALFTQRRQQLQLLAGGK
jgi:hypothetical protein